MSINTESEKPHIYSLKADLEFIAIDKITAYRRLSKYFAEMAEKENGIKIPFKSLDKIQFYTEIELEDLGEATVN